MKVYVVFTWQRHHAGVLGVFSTKGLAKVAIELYIDSHPHPGLEEAFDVRKNNTMIFEEEIDSYKNLHDQKKR